MLLFGAWRQDIRAALQDTGAMELLEQEIWTPGVRHLIALTQIKRKGNAGGQVIARINDARFKTENLSPGRSIWCAISRSREERGIDAEKCS